MANFEISRLTARSAFAVLLRYGLAVAAVATALGTAVIQQHYHSLPRSISHFTLVAIAITFWSIKTLLVFLSAAKPTTCNSRIAQHTSASGSRENGDKIARKQRFDVCALN
jgi:hypothetical protein